LELSKKGLENSDSTVNIQNSEDAISSISTKEENDDCDNHTNDENKDCVDNEKILTVEGENICQLEGNPATQKYEVDIITKGKDKTHSNTSVQSDTILQQEHITQHEDIPDGDISEDSSAILELSKKGLENSDSTVNIQNSEDAISSISTKQENVDCDNHTNDENKVCVDNEKFLTLKGEGICQLEGNPATQKHEVNIVTKGKDKAHSNTSMHLNDTKNPKQKRQKDNTELWDLLNYSKVRLATGSIPKKRQ